MRHLHYALLPIVALAFASCSEILEEFESPKTELEGKFYKQYEITADCSFNDPETRAVLENDAKVNWEDIDKLIIWTGEARDGGNYTVSEANMGEFTRTTKNGVNTFYGYLQDTEAESEPADDTPLYAYVASEYIEPAYVPSNEYDSSIGGYSTTRYGFLGVDLSEQKGTMEDAMKHDLLWATLPYSEFKNNKIPNVQFEHEMSIMKYTLTLEGAGNTTADIRLSGFGMANKVNFRINSGKGQEIVKVKRQWDMVLGDIMLRNVEVKNDVATIYVALYPSWYTEMQAFVTLADGKRATASVGGNFEDYPIEYTFEPGKIYTASATVEPVEVTAKIGDYYNSDGTYTVEPQSNSIGIVFSTETSARDFADGFTNGYVMALKATSSSAWSSETGKIFPGEGKTPSRMGDTWYYDKDGRYETDIILKYRAEHGDKGCEAAYAAHSFQPMDDYIKPVGASDWYLPNFGLYYEILSKLGGLRDCDTDAIGWKTEYPKNFVNDAKDIDVCLTYNNDYCIWKVEGAFDNGEQTLSHQLMVQMNNRLEKAKQAGASVTLFNIVFNEDPDGSNFPYSLATTVELSSGAQRFVAIDGGQAGNTNNNGYISMGTSGTKRFPQIIIPVLAF